MKPRNDATNGTNLVIRDLLVRVLHVVVSAQDLSGLLQSVLGLARKKKAG